MSKLPISCPVCHGPMNVLVYYCPECDVTVEGEFVPEADPIHRLSNEQRNFLLTPSSPVKANSIVWKKSMVSPILLSGTVCWI